MAIAICGKCGRMYRWRARRGYRLADFPSPCCNAPGLGMGKTLRKQLIWDDLMGCYRVRGIGTEIKAAP